MLKSGPKLEAPKTQRCGRCSRVKSIDQFEKVVKKGPKQPDGYKKICIECNNKPKKDGRVKDTITKRERLMGKS